MLNQSLYIFSSKMAGYVIRLALPYFLVRLLTVSDFGAYRQFFLLEMYIAGIFQLGLTQALYYFIPRDVKNAGSYLLNSVLMNLAVFGLAFTAIGLAAGPLSRWTRIGVLQDAFWQLAAYVMIMVLAIACDSYLVARQRVKAAAFFEVAGQALSSVMCVIAAFATRRLDAILLALVASRAIQLLGMLAYIHWRLHGFRAERYFIGIREQLRYGIVLGASGTIFSLMIRLHEFFVSRYYGTEGFGIYSAGCTELPFIPMFTQSLAAVALGQFARLEQEKNWEGIRALWRRVLVSSYAVALPVIVLLLLVSKPLILFMFTDAYAAAVPIFQVNTLSKIALVFNSALILRAIDRNDISIWATGVSLAVAPALFWAANAAFGMVGIIAANGLVMLGCRLGGNIAMNQVIPARLPYVVRPGELVAFYREAWGKVREAATKRLPRGRRTANREGR